MTSTSAAIAARVVLTGDAEPAQQRAGVAGGTQRERLVDRRDPEPVGAGLAGRAGDRHHAVAVAVGLDHHHEGGRGAGGGEGADVGPKGLEVDDELGPDGTGRGILRLAHRDIFSDAGAPMVERAVRRSAHVRTRRTLCDEMWGEACSGPESVGGAT